MPFGAVSQDVTSTEKARSKKDRQTDSTIITASVLHRAGAHSMLRLQPESNVTLFSQIDHLKTKGKKSHVVVRLQEPAVWMKR